MPVWALVLTFFIGLFFMLPFPSWSSLVGVLSNATVFTFVIGPVAATVLRRTMPDLPRPFRLGGLGFIAPAAFVIASLIIYWSGWSISSIVEVFILIGVLLYGYGASSFADDTAIYGGRYLRSGIWLVAYILFILAMTAFGSKNFGAPVHVIPYPLDVLVVIAGSLVFYYWAVASGIVTFETERKNQELARGRSASAD